MQTQNVATVFGFNSFNAEAVLRKMDDAAEIYKLDSSKKELEVRDLKSSKKKIKKLEKVTKQLDKQRRKLAKAIEETKETMAQEQQAIEEAAATNTKPVIESRKAAKKNQPPIQEKGSKLDPVTEEIRELLNRPKGDNQ